MKPARAPIADQFADLAVTNARRIGRIQGCIESALIDLKYGNTESAIRCLREAIK